MTYCGWYKMHTRKQQQRKRKGGEAFFFPFISFLHGKKDSMASSSLKMQTYADLLDDRSLFLYSFFFSTTSRSTRRQSLSLERKIKRGKKKRTASASQVREISNSLVAVPCRFFFFSLPLYASATRRKRCEGSLHTFSFFFSSADRCLLWKRTGGLSHWKKGEGGEGKEKKEKRCKCSEKTLRSVFLCGVLHAR